VRRVMKKILSFLLLFIFFNISAAYGFTEHDTYMYYFSSDEKPIIAWSASTGLNVKYDLYIKRFEWDEIVVKIIAITELQTELTFPKSGIYIVQVRARQELTENQITIINSYTTKEQLISKVVEYKLIEDIDTDSLTIEEIKAGIISYGWASGWTISDIDGAGAVVNGEAIGWWCYSYVAPPGSIVIGGVDTGPDGP
jgi:hypothetical protein